MEGKIVTLCTLVIKELGCKQGNQNGNIQKKKITERKCRQWYTWSL